MICDENLLFGFSIQKSQSKIKWMRADVGFNQRPQIRIVALVRWANRLVDLGFRIWMRIYFLSIRNPIPNPESNWWLELVSQTFSALRPMSSSSLQPKITCSFLLCLTFYVVNWFGFGFNRVADALTIAVMRRICKDCCCGFPLLSSRIKRTWR